MLQFIIGFLVGGICGVMVMALIVYDDLRGDDHGKLKEGSR